MSRSLLQDYFHQPDTLPPEVEQAFARALVSEKIHAFAMSDLDGKLRFTQRWLALSDGHLALAEPEGAWQNGATAWVVVKFA